MNVIKDLRNFQMKDSAVVTIGKFDGLHRGHRELIRTAVEETKSLKQQGAAAETVVFSFDMSAQMLLTKKERRAMLGQMGVETIIECPFEPGIIRMSAEEFVTSILLGQLHAKCIVIGEDFRFGYERRGDVSLLKNMAEKYDFSVDALPDIMDENHKISSSVIREELARGNMEKVNELLGYSFSVTGKIIHGQQVGRTIGIPTANLIPGRHKLLPPNGVYYSLTEIEGRKYHAVTDIGTKPTVNGQFVGVEAHLLDFSGDIYGEKMTVELLHFSRPEIKFSSLEELQRQIERDFEGAETYFRGTSIEK